MFACSGFLPLTDSAVPTAFKLRVARQIEILMKSHFGSRKEGASAAMGLENVLTHLKAVEGLLKSMHGSAAHTAVSAAQAAALKNVLNGASLSLKRWAG